MHHQLVSQHTSSDDGGLTHENPAVLRCPVDWRYSLDTIVSQHTPHVTLPPHRSEDRGEHTNSPPTSRPSIMRPQRLLAPHLPYLCPRTKPAATIIHVCRPIKVVHRHGMRGVAGADDTCSSHLNSASAGQAQRTREAGTSAIHPVIHPPKDINDTLHKTPNFALVEDVDALDVDFYLLR